jgi:hypothetical protein
MKETGVKLVKIAAVACSAIAIMAIVRPKLGERMERMLEEAPDDFPPKWMFNNISAIRKNTERILESLENRPTETEAA